MTQLAHLGSTNAAVAWLRQRAVGTLVADSRNLSTSDTAEQAFVAWPGYLQDARRFVPAALDSGACACLVEAQGVERFGFDDVRIGAVHGLKSAAGVIANDFLGLPSQHLSVLAVTGTNGKTSTAWWIAQALSQLGMRCGVVGTLGVGLVPNLVATDVTTPDPITLQTAFRRFLDQGCTACAIEVSSIGIVEQRLAGTSVKVALLTNFTQDHLDYHADMDAYWQAKAELFEWPGLHAAVLNIDDEKGAMLAAKLGNSLDVWTYSMHRDARLRASAVSYQDASLVFDLHESGTAASVRCALIGEYNVANLLAVIGGLRALGVPLQDAAAVCAQLTSAPGRMQRVSGSGREPLAVVDYAHTPDALEKALTALQPIAMARGGKLWCVFGCGGHRDTGKRSLMGAVAERFAARVVLTSDNPRGESPGFIVSQILLGVVQHERVDVIEDRREAIAYALESAESNDVVLIAGKGHEETQELAGFKKPFSDVLVAQALLARRSEQPAGLKGGAA